MTHAFSPLSGTHVFHVEVKLCIQRDWSEVSESDLKGLSWGLLFYSDGSLPLVSQPLAQEQAQRQSDPQRQGSVLFICASWGWRNSENYPHSKLSSKGLLVHFPKVTCWIWINNENYIVMLEKLASKGAFFAPPTSISTDSFPPSSIFRPHKAGREVSWKEEGRNFFKRDIS